QQMIMPEVFFHSLIRLAYTENTDLNPSSFSQFPENPEKFHYSGNSRSCSRPGGFHSGGSEKAVDQYCIENDVQRCRRGTDDHTHRGQITVFHNTQIDL